jgi:hypothetical protein
VNVSDERRTVKTRSVSLAAALAVLLLAVAAVASGCGSSSSTDDGVAALDETTTTEESTPAAEEDDENQTEEDRQEAALEWAKCMREHGIDVPDPEFGADGRGTVRVGGGPGFDPRSEKFRKAQEECGTPFGRSGPPALSEEERQEFQETMLAFAKCMREHGVDMPDPEFGDGGRGVFRMGPGPGTGTADTERFEEAQEACQPILEELRERREAETESEGSGS